MPFYLLEINEGIMVAIIGAVGAIIVALINKAASKEKQEENRTRKEAPENNNTKTEKTVKIPETKTTAEKEQYGEYFSNKFIPGPQELVNESNDENFTEGFVLFLTNNHKEGSIKVNGEDIHV